VQQGHVASAATPWHFHRIAEFRGRDAPASPNALPKNADDHESELCAYIRRHLLKIVAATASAPRGDMLAKHNI
jgi:hypothetical protein